MTRMAEGKLRRMKEEGRNGRQAVRPKQFPETPTRWNAGTDLVFIRHVGPAKYMILYNELLRTTEYFA